MGKRVNTAVWLEKQGRWQVKVQKDNERRTFTSSAQGRTGQREANAKADAWLDDGIEGTNTRIQDLYKEFIETKQASTGQSNYLGIMSRYENYISPAIGYKKISAITEQDLQNIINSAYSKKKLAAKTLQNIRGDLTSFLKFCRHKRITTLTPEELTIPAGAAKSQKQILQPADLAKLFNSSRSLYHGKEIDEPYIGAYRLEVLTGLRPGEIIGLRWSNIFNNKIHVQGAINAYGEATSGKNDNAIRTITLSPLAMQVLEYQRTYNDSADTVFDISSTHNYRRRWRKYCEYNDLTAVTPYELRHTFVSVAKVLPDGQVKSIVGHSKNMDTFGIYGHTVDGEDLQTSLQIDAIFKTLLKPTSLVP
ncbi:MAG: tyrosine-type recombinase/integrase [Oscillospiraceae bacterium]